MTSEDFARCLQQMMLGFPNLRTWYEKLPEQPVAGDLVSVTRKDTLTFWGTLFADVELADCLAVIQQMVTGHRDCPRFPDEIPREIRKQAASLARERQAVKYKLTESKRGECHEAYCSLCGDSGLLEVLTPDTVRKLQRGEVVATRQLVRVGVRCSCKAGERYPVWNRESGRGFPRFNPRCMVAVRGLQTVHDIPQLVEAAMALQPANYSQELAEWSNF